MSLTSHIRDPQSPVRNWFASRLPNTQDLAAQANRTLRAGASEPHWARTEGANAPTVGTAVDFLVRACLEPDAPDEFTAPAAVQGALILGESHRPFVELGVARFEEWLNQMDEATLAAWWAEHDDFVLRGRPASHRADRRAGPLEGAARR